MIARIPLDAWRAAHQLVLAVFDATALFPPQERLGLRLALRNAAVTLAVHVVQASSRRHVGPSPGGACSVLADLGVLLRRARQRKLLDRTTWAELESRRVKAARHVWRLVSARRFNADLTAPRADGQGRWRLVAFRDSTTT